MGIHCVVSGICSIMSWVQCVTWGTNKSRFLLSSEATTLSSLLSSFQEQGQNVAQGPWCHQGDYQDQAQGQHVVFPLHAQCKDLENMCDPGPCYEQ